MTITLHWWILPLALALIGIGGGFFIGSRPESGYLQFNPLIGFIWFCAFSIGAVSICVGRLLT